MLYCAWLPKRLSGARPRLKSDWGNAVKLQSFYCLARRNRIMLDLIVVFVTVVSFVLLIGFTVGCDHL